MQKIQNQIPNKSLDITLFVSLQEIIKHKRLLCIVDRPSIVKSLADYASSVEVLCQKYASENLENSNIHIAQFLPGRLPFNDRTFDIIVVPDVSCLGIRLSELLAELSRIVSNLGLVFVGAINTNLVESSQILTNYEISEIDSLDLCADLKAHFKVVRMMAQTPCMGYSFLDCRASDNSSEPVLDDSLIRKRQEIQKEIPSRFIGICSNHLFDIDALPAVQVPFDTFSASSLQKNREGNSVSIEEEKLQDEEVIRLEQALSQCGCKLRGLQEELEYRAALVRDLAERTRYIDVSSPAEFSTERNSAVKRALEAEAGRIEATLRLDELSGYLAIEGISPQKTATTLEIERANLLGTVRGLKSRLAELEEMRETAEARLFLLEHDMDQACERENILKNKLEELGEQFELELSRSRVSSATENSSQDFHEGSDFRGQYQGLLMRCQNSENAILDLLSKVDTLQDKIDHSKTEVTILRAQIVELQLTDSVIKSHHADTEKDLEESQRICSEATTAKIESDQRLLVLEKDIERQNEEIKSLQASLQLAIEENEQLNKELQVARSESISCRRDSEQRTIDLKETLKEARDTLYELDIMFNDTNRDKSTDHESTNVKLTEVGIDETIDPNLADDSRS